MAQTHTSVPCPSCRRPLLGGARACPGCGWSSVAQASASSSPAGAPVFRPCPSCGGEAVQRVPAVVGAGTWTSHANTMGGYGGHSSDGTDFSGTFAGSTFGGGSTDLAARLAPPRDPHRVYSGWFFAGLGTLGYGGYSVAMACGIVGYQTPEMTTFFLGGGLLLLALSGLCWWRFALHQGELAEEKRAYPERMRCWGSLFYCARCDAVYDPASGRAASPHGIGSLLD